MKVFDCLTRNETKLGDLIVPKFTKGTIMTDCDRITANAPGVIIPVSIFYHDCRNIEQQMLKIDPVRHYYGHGGIHLDGFIFRFSTQDLYIIYKPDLKDVQLYKWQSQKLIVPITEDTFKPEWMKTYDYLGHVINCFDDWFAEWVNKNCKFRKCSKSDREENSELEPGTMILTDEGLDNFYEKQKELMINLGDVTGYTFEFKGGLNWND